MRNLTRPSPHCPLAGAPVARFTNWHIKILPTLSPIPNVFSNQLAPPPISTKPPRLNYEKKDEHTLSNSEVHPQDRPLNARQPPPTPAKQWALPSGRKDNDLASKGRAHSLPPDSDYPARGSPARSSRISAAAFNSSPRLAARDKAARSLYLSTPSALYLRRPCVRALCWPAGRVPAHVRTTNAPLGGMRAMPSLAPSSRAQMARLTFGRPSIFIARMSPPSTSCCAPTGGAGVHLPEEW